MAEVPAVWKAGTNKFRSVNRFSDLELILEKNIL